MIPIPGIVDEKIDEKRSPKAYLKEAFSLWENIK
jgi:hypothetical protein